MAFFVLWAALSSDDLIDKTRFNAANLDGLAGCISTGRALSSIRPDEAVLIHDDSSWSISQMLNGGSLALISACAFSMRNVFSCMVC
jgi:hypothetical protein